MAGMPARTGALTGAALIGFAANSILCRLALGPRRIDAASFTGIRLLAGAVALAILVRLVRMPKETRRSGSWISAAALFGYAAAFSFAYLQLGAGPGALILFGTVQATMIGWGCIRGRRPGLAEGCGIVIALAGLAALTLPGASAPDKVGSGLMALAGIAWGVYSLRGHGSTFPLAATADNFARSLPLAGALVLATLAASHPSREGVALAVVFGAITSGVCYSLWYAALRRLATTQAAVVQLSVPLLAALGGVVLLGETLSMRLIVSGALILGGVALALKGRTPSPVAGIPRARGAY